MILSAAHIKRHHALAGLMLLPALALTGCTNPVAVLFGMPQGSSARSSSVAAKSDVVQIGESVASYFVDVNGPLTLSAAGASGWMLQDPSGQLVDQGKLTSGDVLGRSLIKDGDHFCVAVGTASGNYWRYTQDGLYSGDC